MSGKLHIGVKNTGLTLEDYTIQQQRLLYDTTNDLSANDG